MAVSALPWQGAVVHGTLLSPGLAVTPTAKCSLRKQVCFGTGRATHALKSGSVGYGVGWGGGVVRSPRRKEEAARLGAGQVKQEEAGIPTAGQGDGSGEKL